MPTKKKTPKKKKPAYSHALAAKRGAALLDNLVGPAKWPKKIKKPLEMGDPGQCVLGQVHEDFSRGLNDLAVDGITKAMINTSLNGLTFANNMTLAKVIKREFSNLELDSVHYGFDLPVRTGRYTDNDPRNLDWELLGTAWTKEIAKRVDAQPTVVKKATVRK